MSDAAKHDGFTFSRVLAEEIESIRPGSAFASKASAQGGPPIQNPTVEDLQRENFKRGASALCLSGGGIRSAAFSLGAVQGLAKRGYLHKFDYLFTVSGGGYTGSLLAAWVYRAYRGIHEVIEGLRDPTCAPADPVGWLRRYTKYLSPRLGVFSLDTWTLIATYLRNLLLNWLILIPLLGLMVAVPFGFLAGNTWLAAAITDKAMSGPNAPYLVMGFGIILVAFASYCLRWRTSFIEQDVRTEKRIGFDGFIVLGASIGAWLIALGWYSLVQSNESLSLVAALIIAVVVQALALLLFIATKDENAWNADGWLFLALGFLLSGLVLGVTLILLSQVFANAVVAQDPRVFFALAPSAIVLCVVLGEIVFAGVSSKGSGDFHREWWSRIDAELLRLSIVWAAFASMVLLLPDWLASATDRLVMKDTWTDASTIALIVSFGGGLARILFLRGREAQREEMGNTSLSARFVEPAISTFAALFLVLLFSWLAVRFEQIACLASGGEASFPCGSLGLRGVLLVALGLGVSVLAFSTTVNINRFSLHGMYRERLIRAFLGGSRARRKMNVAVSSEREKLQFEPREENPYTDFDPVDNPVMSWLMPGRQLSNDFPNTKRPFLVINCALNLVAGENLAWQERKAASFTISPLHAGSSRLAGVGYCNSTDLSKEMGGITLGTALTISGAAVSPNAGYHSRPLITFLMTLFNARLGWWIGKPAVADARVKESPPNALLYMFRELFGLTHDAGDWVYLSDGGHFDNLGLYEAVQRGCKYIVAVDGSADPERKFDDLGNAIRKIRVDLDIPVERQAEWLIGNRDKGRDGRYCAVFAIRYEGRLGTKEPGWLVYIKSAIYPHPKSMVPTDVLNYALQTPEFPHEPTAQQFFGEAQFESYRALGEHEIGAILDPFEGAEDFDDLVTAASEYATMDASET